LSRRDARRRCEQLPNDDLRGGAARLHRPELRARESRGHPVRRTLQCPLMERDPRASPTPLWFVTGARRQNCRTGGAVPGKCACAAESGVRVWTAVEGARLILTCGLPGAGKTALARRLAADRGAVRLTKDEWLWAL